MADDPNAAVAVVFLVSGDVQPTNRGWRRRAPSGRVGRVFRPADQLELDDAGDDGPVPSPTAPRRDAFGVEGLRDLFVGLAHAPQLTDAGERGLLARVGDELPVRGPKPVGGRPARETSVACFPRTSGAESQRDHGPFVFSDGAENLTDHFA
jgi:hypothetical protein